MLKRYLIFSGGEYSRVQELRPDDFVIACDRGLLNAGRAGVLPDLIVGDFDSYNGDLPPDVEVLRYPSEKDDTDTMIAVRYAVEHGAGEIVFCSALGGRLDHSFANIQSAVYAVSHGIKASIICDDTRIFFLRDGEQSFEPQDGWSLSVFSISDKCENVSISGAKYELDNAVITNGFPVGVSNDWKSGPARVSVGCGILMIVESRMETGD